MRDTNSGIWNRRQNLELERLAPIVGDGDHGDMRHAEPAFSDGLCKIIVAYWRERGQQVRAWVESEIASAGRVYVIRTSGIPVRSC